MGRQGKKIWKTNNNAENVYAMHRDSKITIDKIY